MPTRTYDDCSATDAAFLASGKIRQACPPGNNARCVLPNQVAQQQDARERDGFISSDGSPCQAVAAPTWRIPQGGIASGVQTNTCPRRSQQ